MDDFELKVIAALVHRAEGGDDQAALRLHQMYAAGIRHPALIPYQEQPRTASRHRVRPRRRGRPSGLGDDRHTADGTYHPNGRNTLWTEVPAATAEALALVVARREGHQGQAAYDRAVDVLYTHTGRYVSADTIRRLATEARQTVAEDLLSR